MKLACAVVPLFLAVALVGCAPKISESDLVGGWSVDPAAIAKKVNAPEANMSFAIQANHSYAMVVPQLITVKGTWSYQDMKLTVTPTTFAIPMGLGTPKDLPIPQVMQEVQAFSSDPKLASAMKTLSEQTIFDVSRDGKKLSENGKPALIRTN